MKEEFTAEEQAAMTAMKADTAPEPQDVTEQPKEEPETREEPKAEEPKEPEFKTSREKPAEKPPEGFVPHQAMHAERMKRQELERKVAELEARLPKPEEEKPPQWVDPLVDPEGFRKYDEWRSRQSEEKLEQITRSLREREETAARVRKAAELEAEFAAETPDYPQATQFLHQARVSELAAMGFSQEQIGAQLRQDALGVFNAAQQIGMNPAELLYIRAQRAGYRRQEAPKAPEVPSEADRVVALDKAQKATQGLGSATGPQMGQLTARDLAAMSEAELAKVPADVKRRAMGG